MKRLQNPTETQLNLPLLTQSPVQLPPHCSKDLALAMAELLLSVARACIDGRSGEQHASETQ
jgi:hypothetical protein